MKRYILCAVTVLILSACRTIQPIPAPAPQATTPSVAATPLLIPTIATTAIAPTAIPTILPAATAAVSTTSTLSSIDGWAVIDRRDPTITDVITTQVQGYAVDPDWAVAQIDYAYRWSGLGTPVFDAQHLTLQDGAFVGLTRTVALTEVQALVASLTNLHPVSMLVGGQTHTDDYPSWHVRLIGTDGREVNLSSNSTILPDGVPWNVYSNGRIFAQYDGALTKPLFRLFQSPYGETAGAFFPGGGDPNRMPFNSEGLPPEFTVGYSGLSAIRGGFEYQTNPISQTLEGTIIGHDSAGLGNMVIDTITDVVRVQIEPAAGSWLSCPLTPISTRDAAGAVWTFSCHIPSATANAPFRYAIRMVYETPAGERETSGILMGVWQSVFDGLVLQPSEELQAALDASPDARALFSEHVLGWVDYAGSIELNSRALTGTFRGEAILLGSTRLNDQRVRYVLHVPFAIEDEQFTYLTLTRAKLDALLHDALNQPLTRNVLAADPTLIVTLFYDEKTSTPPPVIEGLLSSYRQQYLVAIKPCVGLPGAGEYPTDTMPFRAFSFSQAWWSRREGPEFMLIDNDLALLSLSFNEPYTDVLSRVLLPTPLIADELQGVSQIDLERPSEAWNIGLTIRLPYDASDAVVTRIKEGLPSLLSALHTTAYKTWLMAEDIATRVNNDGRLELVACKP